jgi:hypothetical protein
MFKEAVIERFAREFGQPSRVTLKVTAFESPRLGIVVQTDQPNREDAAFVWLPYPPDSGVLPAMALEYPGESGRHSGTYPTPGLEKGKPALKLVLRTERELEDVVSYIRALASSTPLPVVKASPATEIEPAVSRGQPQDDGAPIRVDVFRMPPTKEPKPRREAIPRAVQREVWQRDGGRCVECGTKERLCFDHIVPFSRGGSNSVRNLQLLCEGCNGTKGNRI